MKQNKLIPCVVILALFINFLPLTVSAASDYYTAHGNYKLKYWKTSTSSAVYGNFWCGIGFKGDSVIICSGIPPSPETGVSFVGWGTYLRSPYRQVCNKKNMPIDTVTIWARYRFDVSLSLDPNGGKLNGSKAPYKNTQYTTTWRRKNSANFVPSTNTSEYISDATGSFRLPTPDSRNGYIFKGWNTNPNGTGTNYNAGQTIYLNDKNTTLYANWEEKEKFYITYDANGGSLEDVPQKQEITYEKAAYVTSEVPSMRGTTFVEWNTKPLGTGKSYASGVQYKKANSTASNVTLYAQYGNPNILYVPSYVVKKGLFSVKSENKFIESQTRIKKVEYQMRDGTKVLTTVSGKLAGMKKEDDIVTQTYSGKFTSPGNLDKININMIVTYENGSTAQVSEDIDLIDAHSDYQEGIRYISNGFLPNEKSKWWFDTKLRNELIKSMQMVTPEEVRSLR